jgi:hypothetical protein
MASTAGESKDTDRNIEEGKSLRSRVKYRCTGNLWNGVERSAVKLLIRWSRVRSPPRSPRFSRGLARDRSSEIPRDTGGTLSHTEACRPFDRAQPSLGIDIASGARRLQRYSSATCRYALDGLRPAQQACRRLWLLQLKLTVQSHWTVLRNHRGNAVALMLSIATSGIDCNRQKPFYLLIDAGRGRACQVHFRTSSRARRGRIR